MTESPPPNQASPTKQPANFLVLAMVGVFFLCIGVVIGILLGQSIQKEEVQTLPSVSIPQKQDLIPPPPVEDGQKFCTMEVMECPDGSYVGRSGPNCEFAPCTANTESSQESSQNQINTNYPNTGFGEDSYEYNDR